LLLGFERQRARRYGIRAGRSGCVTVIQRFGGALNLDIHFHTLLFDERSRFLSMGAWRSGSA
jgi:hypothetical protein